MNRVKTPQFFSWVNLIRSIGGQLYNEDWLFGIWQGADACENRAINHVLDHPQPNVDSRKAPVSSPSVDFFSDRPPSKSSFAFAAPPVRTPQPVHKPPPQPVYQAQPTYPPQPVILHQQPPSHFVCNRRHVDSLSFPFQQEQLRRRSASSVQTQFDRQSSLLSMPPAKRRSIHRQPTLQSLQSAQHMHSLPSQLPQMHSLAPETQPMESLPSQLRQMHSLSPETQPMESLPSQLRQMHSLSPETQPMESLPSQLRQMHSLSPEAQPMQSLPSQHRQMHSMSPKTPSMQQFQQMQQAQPIQQFQQAKPMYPAYQVQQMQMPFAQRMPVQQIFSQMLSWEPSLMAARDLHARRQQMAQMRTGDSRLDRLQQVRIPLTRGSRQQDMGKYDYRITPISQRRRRKGRHARVDLPNAFKRWMVDDSDSECDDWWMMPPRRFPRR